MIYAVGDVHGEAGALREILGKIPVTDSDLIIFLGDIIDRGPDSFDCVEQILTFERCRKIFIHGNHEETMLSLIETGETEGLLGMGGHQTLDSYARAGYPITAGDPAGIPSRHAQFYAQTLGWTLPFYITDDFIFTHAGWNLSLPLERQSPEAMRWGGVRGYDTPIWQQTLVRGHIPFPKVMFARTKRYIGVDTGCGMGGLLSAVSLPEMKIWTARPASFRPNWYAQLHHER